MKYLDMIMNKLFCLHDWEEGAELFIQGDLKSYRVYHFCCKKCGKFKRIKSH